MPAVVDISTLATPFGEVAVATSDALIVRVYLPGATVPPGTPSANSRRAAEEIAQFLDGTRTHWGVEFAIPEATPFRTAVWRALSEIPYGQTRTYGELAAHIGRPGAARAVGTACATNPLPLLVPCHRVVPATGGTGSYAGDTEMKKVLLEMERTCHVVASASTMTSGWAL